MSSSKSSSSPQPSCSSTFAINPPAASDTDNCSDAKNVQNVAVISNYSPSSRSNVEGGHGGSFSSEDSIDDTRDNNDRFAIRTTTLRQTTISSDTRSDFGAYQIRSGYSGHPIGHDPQQELANSSVLTSSNDGTIIREIPDEDNSVSGVLRYCKRRVLLPYLKLLGIIGIKPFNPDSPESWTCSAILNKFYIVIVVLLLLTGYILQFLTCFRRDYGFHYKKHVPVDPYKVKIVRNANTSTINQTSIYKAEFSTSSTESPNNVPSDSEFAEKQFLFENICDGNAFFIHAFPSFLHFMSFAYMLCLYWLNHDEQLQNLMERVFIQATQAHSTYFSQKRVMKTLKFLMLFGTSWLIFSVISLSISIVFDEVRVNFWSKIGFMDKQILVWLMGFSTLWQDAVQLTIIISYCIHCHLLCIYLEFIHSRISQHSITLAECIKEIGEIDKLLRYINSELASGLLPLLFLDLILLIGSVFWVGWIGENDEILGKMLDYCGCGHWLIIIALPLIQASKLSTALKKVRELGHLVRMRPFGYQNYQQSDLDSFLLFVSSVKMDVRILKIPLTATNISVITFLVSFVLLLWGYLQE